MVCNPCILLQSNHCHFAICNVQWTSAHTREALKRFHYSGLCCLYVKSTMYMVSASIRIAFAQSVWQHVMLYVCVEASGTKSIIYSPTFIEPQAIAYVFHLRRAYWIFTQRQCIMQPARRDGRNNCQLAETRLLNTVRLSQRKRKLIIRGFFKLNKKLYIIISVELGTFLSQNKTGFKRFFNQHFFRLLFWNLSILTIFVPFLLKTYSMFHLILIDY